MRQIIDLKTSAGGTVYLLFITSILLTLQTVFRILFPKKSDKSDDDDEN